MIDNPPDRPVVAPQPVALAEPVAVPAPAAAPPEGNFITDVLGGLMKTLVGVSELDKGNIKPLMSVLQGQPFAKTRDEEVRQERLQAQQARLQAQQAQQTFYENQTALVNKRVADQNVIQNKLAQDSAARAEKNAKRAIETQGLTVQQKKNELYEAQNKQNNIASYSTLGTNLPGNDQIRFQALVSKGDFKGASKIWEQNNQFNSLDNALKSGQLKLEQIDSYIESNYPKNSWDAWKKLAQERYYEEKSWKNAWQPSVKKEWVNGGTSQIKQFNPTTRTAE